MKIFIFEFRGLGDGVIASAMLRQLLADGYEVSCGCQRATAEILRPSYPAVHFMEFKMPWTEPSVRNRIWRWNWPALLRFVWRVRLLKCDTILTIRPDPREHFVMWLTGIGRRIGAPKFSQFFLTDCVQAPSEQEHRLEWWKRFYQVLSGCPASDDFYPFLDKQAYHSSLGGQICMLSGGRKICAVHVGGSAAIRRWPLDRFEALIQWLKNEYGFYIVLIKDMDGYGTAIESSADYVVDRVSIHDLLSVIDECDFYVGNDSGPMHMASVSGVPTIGLFGPGSYEMFRPLGPATDFICSDACSWRPCNDHCKLEETLCWNALTVEMVKQKVKGFLK